MVERIDPAIAAELYDLYSELQLISSRAASALRLAANWDAPVDDMLARFRDAEARATAVWARIAELQATISEDDGPR